MSPRKEPSSDQFQQMQEDRRPGFQALCDELAAKYPHWSRPQVEANAKLEWDRRNPNNSLRRKP